MTVARARAEEIMQWLDALDPALLKDADLLGEQLIVRGTRLCEWAQERGSDAQSRIERKSVT